MAKIKKIIKWLALTLLLALLVIIVLGWIYGIRFPGGILDPKQVSYSYSDNNITIEADGAYFQEVQGDTIYFRSFAPNTALTIEYHSDYDSQNDALEYLVLSNIHSDALDNGSAVEANKQGLSRSYNLQDNFLARTHSSLQIASENKVKQNLTVSIDLPFPKQKEYVFASGGDTGGAHELYWLQERARQLGADFILHVGDINYQKQDLLVLGDVLAKSTIPVYMAIGNHEFHEDGAILHQYFSRIVGPLNSTFVLGSKRYINMDTAVGTYFFNRGNRGELLRSITPLSEQDEQDQYIVLTHRPLSEPLFLSHPDQTGVKKLGHLGEPEWLRETINKLGADTWIAGDIHVAHDFDDEGIYTYLVGEGLAFEDLLVGQKTARLVIGRVKENQPIAFEWQLLNMPDDGYCSDRVYNLIPNVQAHPVIVERIKASRALCLSQDVYQFMEKYGPKP